MTMINAAVVREIGGVFAIERIELDEPRADEVRVRIAGVGLCHTDLVVRDQYFPTPLPAVLGHEGAGVVEKVGSAVTKVVVGDHVVLSFASCGGCINCQSGRYGYCSDLYGRNFSGARPDGSSPCRSHDQTTIRGRLREGAKSYAKPNVMCAVQASGYFPMAVLSGYRRCTLIKSAASSRACRASRVGLTGHTCIISA